VAKFKFDGDVAALVQEIEARENAGERRKREEEAGRQWELELEAQREAESGEAPSEGVFE
jgi:hypothetical protein